jgi:heptosyltransferase II
VVLPSWIGDAVMATPTLRLLRELLPGSFIGGLCRPGIDDVLAGSDLLDELHVGRSSGVMGPKRLAQKLRPRRYDAALLLTGSFSTALITRIAGIPERVGYERDARSLLLTDGIEPPRRRDTEPYSRSRTNPSAFAPLPACDYYHALAAHFLRSRGLEAGPPGPLELTLTYDQREEADEVLTRGGLDPHERPRFALLNPGANNPAKRWPAQRFAALADYLARHHGLAILINGAPSEAALVREIIEQCNASTRTLALPELGHTLGSLKGLVARAGLMVTNDTGPRHIAAAFGVPLVTLFGPTDRRWTTIPFHDEIELVADPFLPEEEVANDHPERCRVDRIGLGDVVAAANTLLTRAATA